MGKIRMPSTARIDVCKYIINQDLGVPSQRLGARPRNTVGECLGV